MLTDIHDMYHTKFMCVDMYSLITITLNLSLSGKRKRAHSQF